MRAALAILGLGGALIGQVPPPSYSLDGFTNAASNERGSLAPGSLVSLYGSGLSFVTRAATGDDIRNNRLPTRLPGVAVSVTIGGLPAPLLYVSPTQINFIIPAELTAGQHRVWLVRDSLSGPILTLTLKSYAPGVFRHGPWLLALTPQGQLVSEEHPARPGDWIVIYAVGLGPVIPPVATGVLPDGAFPIRDTAVFRILLNGVELPRERIGYAGVAPGFAALYQINLRLPDSAGYNPTLQVVMAENTSPPNLPLAVQPRENPSQVTLTSPSAFHQ
jgi:uncharacterized protein (TIGR03437 family)